MNSSSISVRLNASAVRWRSRYSSMSRFTNLGFLEPSGSVTAFVMAAR